MKKNQESDVASSSPLYYKKCRSDGSSETFVGMDDSGCNVIEVNVYKTISSLRTDEVVIDTYPMTEIAVSSKKEFEKALKKAQKFIGGLK